jgi:hypothetical protein
LTLKYFKLEIVNQYSRTPLIRTLVIRIPSYPDRLGPSHKFVENSTKLTCLEITGYRITYNTVLWLLELEIRPGRKVQTQVHTVNSNSRPSNCHCSLFSKKNVISRFSAYPDGLCMTSGALCRRNMMGNPGQREMTSILRGAINYSSSHVNKYLPCKKAPTKFLSLFHILLLTKKKYCKRL